MFNEKVFRGKHADYVEFLCKDKRQLNEKGVNLFNTKIELYILAPIIGLIYGRKSEIDSSTNSKYTIQLQQIKNYETDLEYVYRMVMLLDSADSLSAEERLDRTFRYDTDENKLAENMKLFDQYVLGGIEVIYDSFKEDLGEVDDMLYHLLEFMEISAF